MEILYELYTLDMNACIDVASLLALCFQLFDP